MVQLGTGGLEGGAVIIGDITGHPWKRGGKDAILCIFPWITSGL